MGSSTGVGDKYRIHIYGDDEKNTTWRYGAPPNYDLVNKLFEQGRTKVWPPGSLEEKVQNMVKTWEMEMFNKTREDDKKTINPDKYTFSLNGRKGITSEEKRQLGGGYNALMQTSLPEKYRCYNPAVETADSSHMAFTTTFPRGFALEIVHVYSGPPVITYKFRHWGFMEGPFQGHKPTGEMIEFYGMAIFHVDENMIIEKVEFFYDRGELLAGLVKGDTTEDNSEEATSKCPFLKAAS